MSSPGDNRLGTVMERGIFGGMRGRLVAAYRLNAWPWVAVPSVMIIGGVLAFLHIGEKSFWEDEGLSFAYAHQGVGGLWHTFLHTDANMTLYYVLLHLWLHLGLSGSESAIRGISATFAVLTLPVIYLLGSRLFGRTAGLVAALVLAVNAFVVEFAQQARSYSLVLLLVTLSSYFFVVELERPSRRSRVGYVIASALAVYAHYFAVFVLIAQVLTLAAMRRRKALTRQWAEAIGGIMVLCLPAAMLAAHLGPGQIDWIPRPTLAGLWSTAVELAGGGWGLLALGLGACAYAGMFAVVTRRGRWQTGFVLAWFLMPILLSFGASYLQTMFFGRYLMVSVPALALATGAGVARLPSRVLAAAAVAALLVLSRAQLAHWYGQGPQQDWRGAAAYVLEREQSGDRAVFVVGGGEAPFEYYAFLEHKAQPQPLDSSSMLPAKRSRIWFVMSHVSFAATEVSSFQQRLARARYRAINTATFDGITTELYVPE
jgi:mannosyltransferase